MASTRDYRAEYIRRVGKAQARGLSRSQARGHAKASESAIRNKAPSLFDERVQIALKALREERNIARAAKAAKIAPERFRKFAIERGAIEKVRGRWQAAAGLPRIMRFPSRGRATRAKLPNFDTASKAGSYLNALKQFLHTNKVTALRSFEGEGVRDTANRFHPFETNPNILYRLAASGEVSFEQIYRIVI